MPGLGVILGGPVIVVHEFVKVQSAVVLARAAKQRYRKDEGRDDAQWTPQRTNELAA